MTGMARSSIRKTNSIQLSSPIAYKGFDLLADLH
jgi:hypothetical protein